MASTAYKTIGDSLKAFQIYFQEANFIQEIPLAISRHVIEDIEIVTNYLAIDSSEFLICESLIIPKLKAFAHTA